MHVISWDPKAFPSHIPQLNIPQQNSLFWTADSMDIGDSTPSLLGLHPDLLVKVLLQLEPRDLQSVSCSCKALALTDSPLWQSLFFHKWDVPRGSHLNYKKLYFRREQLLIYLESVCSRLKPQEEPSLQTLHDGRRVVGAGRFAALCPSKHVYLDSTQGITDRDS